VLKRVKKVGGRRELYVRKKGRRKIEEK